MYLIVMKTLRIVALHPYTTTVEGIRKLLDFDERKYDMEFVWDEEKPEYVLATQIIYYEKKWYKKFVNYLKECVITIFFAGECISPDLNLFDYAVAFDRYLKSNDRVARMPTLRFYRISIFNEYLRNTDFQPDEMMDKRKFCNFMYSNPKSHPNRDKLFYKLSEYKKVDSIGSHLNNTGSSSTRNNADWRKLSIEIRRAYKFSIAAENACFPGYTSEKLLSCLEAHTVPIYWGDPTVGLEFNSKAFINCHEYESFDEVLAAIREIDENPQLYLNMLNQPWQTLEQQQETKMANKRYDDFVYHIFSQRLSEAKRVHPGYHPDLYKKWFIDGFKKPLILSVKQFLKQVARKLLGKKVDIV